MSSAKLLELLSLNSVAVIGASERYESPGTAVILKRQRPQFAGRFYSINPKYEAIHGIDTYKSIQEVPEPPDCVLICVNAGLVPMMLREATETAAVQEMILE